MSDSIDVTAFVLVFPTRDDTEYVNQPYFWIPEENMKLVRSDPGGNIKLNKERSMERIEGGCRHWTAGCMSMNH